jgi:hypothetical protein
MIFQLVDGVTGWGTARISHGVDSFDMRVSYMFDAS